MTSPTLKDRLQDELNAHPIKEDVPENIWDTIHATWTGLWTDAYGEWDERQPSDIYPITDLLSEDAEKRLIQNVQAHIAADVEGLIERMDHSAKCFTNAYSDSTEQYCDCGAYYYNLAIDNQTAALARYMKGTE